MQLAPLNTLTTDVCKTILTNGLTVLTKAIHTAPVVSVQIWYRVGSRNEAPGLNGISHQLEHLLFKGTQTRPLQFGHLFSALGSASNAFTSYDMTAYYGTVGRDKLEALLVLEADRMHHALINADQLASEKRVVISELQGYENSPDYRLSRAVMQQAFPDHPYGLPVGGTKTDVDCFRLEQVQNYYRCYYSPNNAVLVITGDFEEQIALELVKQTFGSIQPSTLTPSPADGFQAQRSELRTFRSSPRPASNSEPLDPPQAYLQPQPSTFPIILREPGSAPLLEAVYPIPEIQHPDIPALEVMDVILSSGRNSRFYPVLVESGLVSQLSAYAATLIEPGWYNISATAAPGQELHTIDQVIQQTIQDLQTQPITAEELNRAKTQLIANFILSHRGIDHQAGQLAYNQIVGGDYHYSDRYLAGIDLVTLSDIQRVATTYLDPAQRTVGYFEPTQIEEQQLAATGPLTQTAEDFSPGTPLDPDLVAQYLPQLTLKPVSPTQVLPEKLELSNGLRVLLLSDHSSPTVTLGGYLPAGNSFDLITKGGVASLTAENLMSGTHTKDDLALATALENKGASLDFGAFREGVDIEGYALAPDLPILLETLADVLQYATFPEQKLDLSRQRALTHLQMELDDPGRLARRVFQQQIYPADHPFHLFPTEDSLNTISREDLVEFHQQHYSPDHTILVLMGDFEREHAISLLHQTLGTWASQSPIPALTFPEVPLPLKVERFHAPLPGKHQVITYMGYRGIERRDSRYYAALILNQVLGGDTLASRLGTEIRDRQGLTYGIHSYFATGAQAGPFAIQLQTAPEDTQQAITSTLTLLKQFCTDGITSAELEAAKRSILNSYPVELADPDILVQRLLMNEVHGLGTDEIRQFPQRIASVSLPEVQAAIQSLIHPDNLVIVTAGPVQ